MHCLHLRLPAHCVGHKLYLGQAKEMLAEFCNAGEEGTNRDAKLQVDEFMRVMVQK